MEINFSTENLIVSNYPGWAGGRFIQIALALHPNILFQNENLARSKMMGEQDIESSYKTASVVFDEKRKTGRHVEYGCQGLAGFHCGHLVGDITADEKLGNQLWKELTNQKKFFFFMVNPGDTKSFRRYTNRKILTLKNFEWIIEQRGGQPDEPMAEDLTNPHSFDMNSINDSILFKNEIYSVLKYLDLPQTNDQVVFEMYLDNLRKGFLETYKIGFESDNDDREFYEKIKYL